MKTRTTIALAVGCVAAGIGIAIYVASTVPRPPGAGRQSVAASAPAAVAEQAASTIEAPLAPRLEGKVLESASSHSGHSLAAATTAPKGLQNGPTQTQAATRPASPPGVPQVEKTVAWRYPAAVGAGPNTPGSEIAPAGTAPQVPAFQVSSGSPPQAAEVLPQAATGGRPDGRNGEEAAGDAAARGENNHEPIAVRFYHPAVEDPPATRAGAPAARGPSPARSPMGPDDYMLPRRSVAEFFSLRRPLDHVGTRYYCPRHLTVAQLQVLIEPLLSEPTGKAYATSPERLAPQVARQPSGQPLLVVRDRLETLDRLDQVIPVLDMAPTYVLFDGMVLDIRLPAGAAIDFHRLAQKRHVTPAEHSRRGTVKTVPSSDADGLKVAYLHGDINGLLEALGAFGVATLTGTPRVAVRQGAEAEIELESDSPTRAQRPEAPTPGDPLSSNDLRLFLRPLAAYEGGMDVEVRAVVGAARSAVQVEQVRAEGPGDANWRSTPRHETVSVVVPEGVTLVIGGLVKPNALDQTPPERPSFLGIKPFWGRSGGERQELLVLVTPRQAGTPQPEVVKAIDALSPGLRRSVAQQYLRAAQRAQASRQLAMALQWSEQALRFDAAEPAAVELYDRLQKSASMASRTFRR